jgi:rubrerythrin
VWFRARLREVLALALASPALAACDGDDVDPAPPVVDASLPTDASLPVDASFDATDAASACAPQNLDANPFGTDAACNAYVSVPCGVPPEAGGSGCLPDVDLCTAVCPNGGFFFTCYYAPSSCPDGSLLADADVVIECNLCPGNLGRRTRGLADPPAVSPPGGGEGRVGDYLARAAYLEAASIDAFEELAARLAAHGAPRRLRQAAARAAADERRHASVTAALARSFGAEPLVPRPHRATRATLESLATENAVEGCVRELMGALVAAHQAAHATDPRIARAMRRIARDEARHAALAWAIDAWATPHLSAAARARVRAAQLEAFEDLRREASRPVLPDVAAVAGMPDAGRAARLVTAFGTVFLTSLPRRLRCASSPAAIRAILPRGGDCIVS